MNATDAQIAEYRDKLLPSIELITARVQLLKSPNPLPDDDWRKFLVELIENSSKKIAVYLANPDGYYADLAERNGTKYISLYEENPSKIPYFLASDIRSPIATLHSASLLLAESADDINLVSEPFTATEKEYLAEIILTGETMNIIITDIILSRNENI